MKITRWQDYFILIALLTLMTAVKAEPLDVSCIYETMEQPLQQTTGHRHSAKSHKPDKWFFWRTANEVEVMNEAKTFGEKWSRSEKKKIFYRVLYHDKKFLLEFQPADLLILGKQTRWKTRTHLISPLLLNRLEKKANSFFKQYEVVRYEGAIAGVNYRVDWLTELKLPVLIEKTSLNKKTITRLKELYPIAKSPYKQLIAEQYEDMDYADIGDNESHPIVSRLQNSSGIGYFHQH